MADTRVRPLRGARAAATDDRTVRLAQRRFARRQWARRWLTWRPVLAAVLVLAVLAGVVRLVFFSGALAVESVQVEGVTVLTPQQVRRVAAVPEGEPLASVDLDAVASRLELLPAVEAVQVSRAWPDTLVVSVTERTPVAVVERDGRVQALDAEGVVFRSYRSQPPGLPVVRTGSRTPTEALAEAAAVVTALPDGLARRVAHVEVQTVDAISLQLRTGTTVMWGSAEESANKARVLEVLLRQPGSVYDVSVPAQPTIRP